MCFFFNDTATTEIYTLSLHDALPISQKQLIVENVAKKLDEDTKKQVMPLLEAILQAQPTIRVKSYAQTNISITMPKNRYEKMGKPQVGDKLQVDLKKI